jgi:acetylornithine deacetylase/succinyl-diaminopimelate desuccinylase-like protein
VNKLIADGFTPKNDVYLAFSGGEEVHGVGAAKIVDYFEEKGITPAFVMDEGGAVVENVFPGVKKPCALIGVAEKGFINLELTAKSNGGHASAPKPHTPVGVLSQACVRLENKPFVDLALIGTTTRAARKTLAGNLSTGHFDRGLSRPFRCRGSSAPFRCQKP